jgi:hypothetical protein
MNSIGISVLGILSNVQCITCLVSLSQCFWETTGILLLNFDESFRGKPYRTARPPLRAHDCDEEG